MAANSLSSRSAGCPRRRSNIVRAFASFLIPAFACVAPLAAQEAGVSLKIDVVAWGDEIGGLSFKAGDRSGDITAHAFRYSEPISYSGPAIMEIYKSGDGKVKATTKASDEDLKHAAMPLKPETDPSAAGANGQAKQGIALELEKRRKKAPNLVALAQLPSGCRRATVLLAPAEGGTFTAYVIDDDPSKLPLGQIRIHNLSPHPIAMRCNGAEPKEIKTRGTLTIPAKDQALSYDLAYQLDGEWKFEVHNIIPVSAEEQTQMIVLRSDNAFFRSADGSAGGFLQTVTLCRRPTP